MECPNCGSMLADEAKFCSLCFTKLDGPGRQPEATSPSGYSPPARELPPDIPAEELAQIRNFSPNPGLPVVPVYEEATPGRKVAIVGGGALVVVILGQILNYLPIPFIGLAAPFIGGAMAGYLLKYQGGRYGLITAGIPAVLGAIVVWIVSASLIGPLSAQTAAQSKGSLPVGAMADMLSGIIWFAVVVGIGSNCLVGYLGGWVGESYADRRR